MSCEEAEVENAGFQENVGERDDLEPSVMAGNNDQVLAYGFS